MGSELDFIPINAINNSLIDITLEQNQKVYNRNEYFEN